MVWRQTDFVIIPNEARVYEHMFRERRPLIDEGLKEYRKDGHAMLLDVREEDEYEEGHVPGSLNLPLSRITEAGKVLSDKDAKLYVYCRSGARSAKACMVLTEMGYHAVNIGGILDYTGEVKTGKER